MDVVDVVVDVVKEARYVAQRHPSFAVLVTVRREKPLALQLSAASNSLGTRQLGRRTLWAGVVQLGGRDTLGGVQVGHLRFS